MFKFTLTSIALLGLASFASAQTNINRIQGNGNTVINRTIGGSGSTNFNRINGNGNTVINRSQPIPSPIPGGDRSSWSPIQPAPVVIYRQPTQYVEPQVEYYQEESAPVYDETCPTPSIQYQNVRPIGYLPQPQPIITRPVIQTQTRTPINLNVNLNNINGNNNRVVNSTTGGGSGLNINRINGNGNTVLNRSRP